MGFILPVPSRKKQPTRFGKKRHKYNAVKTTVDGRVFDSKAEARRYGELKLLEMAGAITELKFQPEFILLEKMPGQRAIKYRADFEYLENKKRIVEDVKGFKTPQFKMKEKMFRAKFRDLELRITK
jgi:hypothetical protein